MTITRGHDLSTGGTNNNPNVGSDGVEMKLHLELACGTVSPVPPAADSYVTLTQVGAFLYSESDGVTTDANDEGNNGYWSYSDILVSANCNILGPRGVSFIGAAPGGTDRDEK